MRVTDIPQRDWPAFLDRLAREHRAWLATVEQDGRIAVREQTLRVIRVDGGIDIELGERAIHVAAPRAVRVEQTGTGAAQAVAIEDEAGGRVQLRFRIAEPPGERGGIAPAEL